MSYEGKYWLWEQLVRRGYSAHVLAARLSRPVEQMARWCADGVPDAFRSVLVGMLADVPEVNFVGMDLPVGPLVVAVDPGGPVKCWRQMALPGMDDVRAVELDNMGYGMAAQRKLGDGAAAVYQLELRLIPGRVTVSKREADRVTPARLAPMVRRAAA